MKPVKATLMALGGILGLVLLLLAFFTIPHGFRPPPIKSPPESANVRFHAGMYSNFYRLDNENEILKKFAMRLMREQWSIKEFSVREFGPEFSFNKGPSWFNFGGIKEGIEIQPKNGMNVYAWIDLKQGRLYYYFHI